MFTVTITTTREGEIRPQQPFVEQRKTLNGARMCMRRFANMLLTDEDAHLLQATHNTLLIACTSWNGRAHVETCVHIAIAEA